MSPLEQIVALVKLWLVNDATPLRHLKISGFDLHKSGYVTGRPASKSCNLRGEAQNLTTTGFRKISVELTAPL